MGIGRSKQNNKEKGLQCVLVSDLDHTMVDHDDPKHTRLLAFNEIWKEKFAKNSMLIFSTGRSPILYKDLKEHVPMLDPDMLVCSVGTEIFHHFDISQPDDKWQKDTDWEKYLDQGWDRSKVLEIAMEFKSDLTLQAETEQRPHKISFHLTSKNEAILKVLEDKLKEAGLKTKVIYSGGVDVDILAEGAGKGMALKFIIEKLQKEGRTPSKGALACGDSGNDAEFFTIEGVKGCIVGNAKDELKKWYEDNKHENVYMAQDRCAGGIIESMKHFDMLSYEPMC
eukprot:TRINITY_DN58218_c0_g1_i1.p1 TRINITY_DN58218_c0_g1~~TRINITY_DN58218_c0_g1_i1.p1  ORF type:complete len:298 (-),score=43.11 TRINITY_DN58218_c0_g1_i1:262-1107(-)